MRKKYPSDITREQLETILPILETARKKTKPREVDLYEVFCALLYLLKSGCQWRMLPAEFPKWELVYYHFSAWRKQGENEEESALSRALKKCVGEARLSNGRTEKTSFCIADAQSVKNTDSAEEKGYDVGKKVSGIKRTIVVNTQGLPHALCVTTADLTDRNGALIALVKNKEELSEVEKVLTDGGYSGSAFSSAVKEIIGAEVEVVKRNELHTFKVLPKRWVVERCFGWLEKCRRLWKNCERKLHTSLQMMVLAFLVILLRRS